MIELDDQQQAARTWFEALRDRICAAFEAIERGGGQRRALRLSGLGPARSGRAPPGGGGVRGVMKGKVFEKVGVNVSTVGGRFSAEFAKTIHGAGEDPTLLRHRDQPGRAHGQSARPRRPHEHALPASRRSAGSAAARISIRRSPMRRIRPTSTPGCAPPAPRTTRPITARFSKWAEDYFFIPHRGVHRGVGGIFYDHLECAAPGHGATFEENFAFTRDVGEAFLDVFPRLVRRRMATPFDRGGPGDAARMARPLCRVQPDLRPRHPVRPQDRRQCRRDPDEPAAAGDLGDEPRRSTAVPPAMSARS